jgi:uncharacterized protein YvpB
VDIREKQFLNNLPRSDNPDAGFVGNPDGKWGQVPPYSYGVHAEPVAAVLRQYGLQAEARRGLSWDDLRLEIAAGRPVIVWVIGQMWTGTPQRYRSSNGQVAVVARFEHTMILVGYTPRSVEVVDAFSGSTATYPLQNFLESWNTLGRMAVTGGLPQPAPPVQPEPPPKPGAPPTQSFTHHSFLPIIYRQPDQVVPAAPAAATLLPEAITVQSGETLVDIAHRYGMDWRRLVQVNSLPYPYTVFAGQILKLQK